MTRTSVPNSRGKLMLCVARFRLGRRGPFDSAKGPNNGRAPRDAPCKVTPRLASLERMDAGLMRAGQLAEPVLILSKGSNKALQLISVPRLGQPVGV